MGQTFRETFGDAPIRKDLMDFFEDVIVERVMLKKSMNLVKIYISYDLDIDEIVIIYNGYNENISIEDLNYIYSHNLTLKTIYCIIFKVFKGSGGDEKN